MKHIILVNPVAGTGNNIKYAERIKILLKKHKIESEIVISAYKGFLSTYVAEQANKEKTRFYSVGGDGTLNEVVTGLLKTDSDVVVVPRGTGNDFIKNLSKYTSMRKIVNNSINLDPQKVDILSLGHGKYCINIASAGFDSLVAKNVDIFRKIPLITGKMKYNLSIFYTLIMNKNFMFKIKIDKNTVLKESFTLVALANGKYYGGGVIPCPDANIQDGLIDICVATRTSHIQKIKFLPKYKKGKHLDLKQIKMYKAKSISIVSKRMFPANVDGEVFYTNRLNVKVIPDAVNIVF